jgi:hypothetical protein
MDEDISVIRKYVFGTNLEKARNNRQVLELGSPPSWSHAILLVVRTN